VGAALGAAAATVNNVPILLGEVGDARADRSGWSQAAEFASLILDSGWAWAATAVAAGWLVSAGRHRAAGAVVGALGGCVALLCATVVYDSAESLFQGGVWSYGDVRRYWLAASVLLGPVLGAAGAAIRWPGRAGLPAALVVPAGAAAQMVVLPPPAESPMAVPVTVTVWCAAAVTAAVVLIRRVFRYPA
jgi:hypothetical protein